MRARCTYRKAPRRAGGLVILASLVVVTMAALVGSAILLRADAGTVIARGELRRAQARAAAWSGVQAVMARLSEQRDDLLGGGAPVLPEQWTFPIESADGELVFRVLQGAGGLPATSENARLDINTAAPEMLAMLPGLNETLAERIISSRPEGGYVSVESLLGVEGIDRRTLMGETQDDEGAHEPTPPRPGGLAVSAPPLIDLLTVWSFDPNVQGSASGESIGVRRVRLPGGWWTDGMAMAIGERFGAPSLFGVGGIGLGEDPPASIGELVTALRGSSIPVESWGKWLDTFTPYDATHRRGLIDLNRAGADVLAAVPGLDVELAGAIVDARDRTPFESRSSTAWIVEVGAVSPEAFVEAADWLTTRSTQWRVIVEGGYEAPTAEGAERGSAPALLDRVVFEAVIDVSTRRTRLATLREVTGLNETLAFSRALLAGDDEPEPHDLAMDDSASIVEPEEPEFVRLRRGPDPLGTSDDVPPSLPAPEQTSDPDAQDALPAPSAGSTGGRAGRWTRGGGS